MTFTTYTAPPQMNRISDPFAPKTDYMGRTKQDINDAEPCDYIDHIGIITDRQEDTLQAFVESELKKEYGCEIEAVVDVIDSEIRGTKVEVFPKESDTVYWGKVALAMKLNEVRKFVEKII